MGTDLVYANDAGIDAGYSYEITGEHIVSHPGQNNLDRPVFAGIFFDTTVDTIEMRGTARPNSYYVGASSHAEIMLDGNEPSTNPNVFDEVILLFEAGDGRDLQITDEDKGEGFWSFNNGNRIVAFTDMESVEEESAP